MAVLFPDNGGDVPGAEIQRELDDPAPGVLGVICIPAHERPRRRHVGRQRVEKIGILPLRQRILHAVDGVVAGRKIVVQGAGLANRGAPRHSFGIAQRSPELAGERPDAAGPAPFRRRAVPFRVDQERNQRAAVPGTVHKDPAPAKDYGHGRTGQERRDNTIAVSSHLERAFGHVDHGNRMDLDRGFGRVHLPAACHPGVRCGGRRRVPPAQPDALEIVGAVPDRVAVDEHPETALAVGGQADRVRRPGRHQVARCIRIEGRVSPVILLDALLKILLRQELHEHPGRIPVLERERLAGDVVCGRLRPFRPPGMPPGEVERHIAVLFRRGFPFDVRDRQVIGRRAAEASRRVVAPRRRRRDVRGAGQQQTGQGRERPPASAWVFAAKLTHR